MKWLVREREDERRGHGEGKWGRIMIEQGGEKV